MNSGGGGGSENITSLKTSFIGQNFWFLPGAPFPTLGRKANWIVPRIWCFFSPKYGGLEEVSSSGFWNSFPSQLLLSELFSFISPTSTVGCILCLSLMFYRDQRGEEREILDSYRPHRLTGSYSKSCLLLQESSEVDIVLTVLCSFCSLGFLTSSAFLTVWHTTNLAKLLDFYRGKASRALDTLRAFYH